MRTEAPGSEAPAPAARPGRSVPQGRPQTASRGRYSGSAPRLSPGSDAPGGPSRSLTPTQAPGEGGSKRRDGPAEVPPEPLRLRPGRGNGRAAAQLPSSFVPPRLRAAPGAAGEPRRPAEGKAGEAPAAALGELRLFATPARYAARRLT